MTPCKMDKKFDEKNLIKISRLFLEKIIITLNIFYNLSYNYGLHLELWFDFDFDKIFSFWI